MSSHIGVRDLRNDTSGVLRRVEAGEELVVTSRGRPVATLAPVRAERRWITREELQRRLLSAQADPGLAADLDRLAGETTDDLDDGLG